MSPGVFWSTDAGLADLRGMADGCGMAGWRVLGDMVLGDGFG